MNVKTTITLSEEHLRYAEKLVENGRYPSLSSVVEAGIRELFGKELPVTDPVESMGAEIRKRLELPRDQWVPWDGDRMFDEIEAEINVKIAQGK